ncbi:hypothetical protein [Halomonas sp. BC04]|uniref:hypothetical protein n=1 Tax=Halomonas sp. BC04 TaxID=1403540 RepID=UPI0004B3914E|nr:hypothetical protein [Halomonas sp. BC04]
MKRLKSFRDLLYRTTKPHNKAKYRNHKRRTGKVQYARGQIDDDTTIEKKVIPGPYWISYRQAWLKKLLEIQKNLNDGGNPIRLIHEDELKHIRLEWLNDPNEPDALDTLPAIYASVYGYKLEWMQDSAGVLSQQDAVALREACQEHGTPIELAIKLLQLEQSLDGSANATGSSRESTPFSTKTGESSTHCTPRNRMPVWHWRGCKRPRGKCKTYSRKTPATKEKLATPRASMTSCWLGWKSSTRN